MKEHVCGISCFPKAVAVMLLLSSFSVFAQTTQEHVHRMAHSVMPFDISKTVHIFKMTESGGVQKVITKDAEATNQITLTQQRLKNEVEKFQRGDYSDLATLHGASMPGLKDLQTGASAIKVLYADLSVGAQITFETTDLNLITARP